MDFCGKCGAPLNGGKYCAKCGAIIETEKKEREQRDSDTPKASKHKLWKKIAIGAIVFVIGIRTIRCFVCYGWSI